MLMTFCDQFDGPHDQIDDVAMGLPQALVIDHLYMETLKLHETEI